MKWFIMVLVFCGAAGANDKLIVDISSVTNDELNKTTVFERPPETANVFNRNKQFFKLGANDVVCEVSFFKNIAALGCEQTKDNKDRVTAESGFEVSTTVDCSLGNESALSFSNKIKKKGSWADFKIKIKCVSEKI